MYGRWRESQVIAQLARGQRYVHPSDDAVLSAMLRMGIRPPEPDAPKLLPQ